MSSILKGLIREGGKRTVKSVADEIAGYIGPHPSDSAIVDAIEHEAKIHGFDPADLFDAVYDHFRHQIDENLHKWFKEKWVRFGPDGKIRGDCARGSGSEGKPKCLPQSKAHNLGKKGRASAAARKRREDPNPERHGKAKNVSTKKKSNEDISHLDEKWSAKYKSSINCSHPKGFSQKAHCAGKKKHNESIEMEMTCEDCGMCQTHGDHTRDTLDEACWKGYHKKGMKTMFGKKYPNCVKNTNEEQDVTEEKCPECGGPMYHESMINEKQDACYHKVKSRYKVWPSAYASGALVQCRKKGAANWGNGGKKNESAIMQGLMREDDFEFDYSAPNPKKKKSGKYGPETQQVEAFIRYIRRMTFDQWGDVAAARLQIEDQPVARAIGIALNAAKVNHTNRQVEAAHRDGIESTPGGPVRVAARRVAALAAVEILGAAVMRGARTPFFFLPMFGFANPDAIPDALDEADDFEFDYSEPAREKKGGKYGTKTNQVEAFFRHLANMTPEQWEASCAAARAVTWNRYTLAAEKSWPAAVTIAGKNKAQAAFSEGIRLQNIAARRFMNDANVQDGEQAGHAANEIQGAAALRARGHAFFYLPMFGFANPDAIPDALDEADDFEFDYSDKPMGDTQKKKTSDIVTPLVQAFNIEHSGSEGMPLHTKSSSKRWRRGDGSYYTDPNSIEAYDQNDPEQRQLQSEFYDWLIQQPGVKSAGRIRGELRSSDYSPASEYENVIFVKRNYATEYFTRSKLRNKNVWHQKTDEDTSYAGGMGQGGNAGESYRKFKPKSAGTHMENESAIMKGLMPVDEAGSPAQQAAIAINMKKHHKKPKHVDEDYTGEFAAEKTPAINPYGGMKDKQYRGAIGEGIISEMPDTSGPVGVQPGGWRTYRPKPAGTKIENAIMRGLMREEESLKSNNPVGIPEDEDFEFDYSAPAPKKKKIGKYGRKTDQVEAFLRHLATMTPAQWTALETALPQIDYDLMMKKRRIADHAASRRATLTQRNRAHGDVWGASQGNSATKIAASMAAQEIQGADEFAAGRFFFLPMFGFDSVDDIPGAVDLEEVSATGQGGGSAGIGGGSMVGGPTTYEQEYGMFKKRGPRRITAMTNEALDSHQEGKER
jgi:hypothetical protein